ATNTARSVVTAITPISYDHMDYLGTSLEQIAKEKAGILKPGVPAVVSRQSTEAWNVLEAVAGRLNAPIWVEDREFRMEDRSGRSAAYRGQRLSIDGLTPSLRGSHQLQNAAVALACVEALSTVGFPVSQQEARTALATTQWPGRLEQIASDPAIVL